MSKSELACKETSSPSIGLDKGEANCRLVKSGKDPVLFPIGIWIPLGSGPGHMLNYKENMIGIYKT